MKELTGLPGGVFDEHGEASTDRWDALREELALVGDGDLETSIVEMKHVMDATHAEWLLRISEYDRRQLADERHRLSTTGWLRSTLRLTGRAASVFVRQARGLVRMPAVGRIAVEGAVAPVAIEQLDRARRRHPSEFQHHESVFADVATYLDPSQLRQAVAHWEQQIDYPSAVARARAQRQRRRLSISQTFDGMWNLTGELDPETGSIVDTAIRSIADRANLDPDDSRRPWQVRADALGDICEHSLRDNTLGNRTVTSGGVKPHVTVTIDAEALLGLKRQLGTISNTAVSPETVDRIVCDSSIVRILTDESGVPVGAGRATRTIPPALRRVLDLRDGGCQWDGCNAPTQWCDAHHVQHWKDGGPTTLGNLTLLCRTHHTATHEHDIRTTHRQATGREPPAIPP